MWGRRRQLEHRVREVEAVLGAAHRGRIPFVGHTLDPHRITLHGHSFGGATVLTVLARMQQQHSMSTPAIASCIVHDPAVDWMADDARLGLLGEAPEESISPPAPPAGDEKGRGAGVGAGAGAGADAARVATAAARFKEVPTMHVFSATWASWKYAGYSRVQDNLAAGLYGKGSVFCALKGKGMEV